MKVFIFICMVGLSLAAPMDLFFDESGYLIEDQPQTFIRVAREAGNPIGTRIANLISLRDREPPQDFEYQLPTDHFGPRYGAIPGRQYYRVGGYKYGSGIASGSGSAAGSSSSASAASSASASSGSAAQASAAATAQASAAAAARARARSSFSSGSGYYYPNNPSYAVDNKLEVHEERRDNLLGIVL